MHKSSVIRHKYHNFQNMCKNLSNRKNGDGEHLNPFLKWLLINHLYTTVMVIEILISIEK